MIVGILGCQAGNTSICFKMFSMKSRRISNSETDRPGQEWLVQSYVLAQRHLAHGRHVAEFGSYPGIHVGILQYPWCFATCLLEHMTTRTSSSLQNWLRSQRNHPWTSSAQKSCWRNCRMIGPLTLRLDGEQRVNGQFSIWSQSHWLGVVSVHEQSSGAVSGFPRLMKNLSSFAVEIFAFYSGLASVYFSGVIPSQGCQWPPRPPVEPWLLSQLDMSRWSKRLRSWRFCYVVDKSWAEIRYVEVFDFMSWSAWSLLFLVSFLDFFFQQFLGKSTDIHFSFVCVLWGCQCSDLWHWSHWDRCCWMWRMTHEHLDHPCSCWIWIWRPRQ